MVRYINFQTETVPSDILATGELDRACVIHRLMHLILIKFSNYYLEYTSGIILHTLQGLELSSIHMDLSPALPMFV